MSAVAGSVGLTARVREVLRREGVLGVAARATAKIAHVSTQLLLRADLNTLPTFAVPEGVTFCRATLQNLERWAELELAATDTIRTASALRLNRGDECIVGLVRGVPATYLWVTRTVRELPRLDWPVAPGSVFVYKTFTLPAHRGHGLNRSAVGWTLHEQRAAGAHTAFVDVAVDNHPSLQALRRAGYRDAGRFSMIKLGPITFTRMSEEVYAMVAEAGRRETI